MSNKEPLVSICCITFNHEKYIGDALDGFLMQETDFPFEIIVHDDASTDNTAKIIEGYAKKDSRIKPILRTKNVKSTGVAIFPFTFAKAQGKYIALCEGDDYWTDSLKLKKQVDKLESNSTLMMSTHETNHIYYPLDRNRTWRRMFSILYWDMKLYGVNRFYNLSKDLLLNNNNFWLQDRSHINQKRKEVNTLSEMANGKWYMSLCSIVMKRELTDPLLDCYKHADGGHHLALLLGAMHGGIYHFNDKMAVKRDQENSISKDLARKKTNRKRDKNINKNIVLKRYKSLKKHATKEQEIILEQMIEDYKSKRKWN